MCDISIRDLVERQMWNSREGKSADLNNEQKKKKDA